MYSGMIKTALALTYIMGVIGSQLGINISNTKEHCHGVPQIVTSMIYTIIPNFFMLGLIMVVLKIFPGWKSSTKGIKEFDKLPQNAKNYIKELERLIFSKEDKESSSPC